MRSRESSLAGLVHEQAGAALAGAADPAAQLVQLREPEALGVLDQHHVGGAHVDADLDDRGRDQHARLAAAKRSIARCFSSGGQLAVQQRDAARRQPLRRARRSTSSAERRPVSSFGSIVGHTT